MKKILTLLSSLSLCSFGAVAVVSCSGDQKFNTFMSYIHDKQTFVYYIGARDCPKCQNTQIKTWEPLTANNNAMLKNILANDPNYSYNSTPWKAGSAGQEAYKNMQLYSDKVDKVSKVFDDTSVKAIINYVIKQTADASAIAGHKPKHLTRQDIGITGLPLFLYFDQGKYEGFYMGEIDRATDDSPQQKATTPSFMWLVRQHIGFHIWPKYHFPSS